MATEDLFLEPSEVARLLGLSSARVRTLALEGRLVVAARTRRGLRLFRTEDVQLYMATIQKRRAGRSPGSAEVVAAVG